MNGMQKVFLRLSPALVPLAVVAVWEWMVQTGRLPASQSAPPSEIVRHLVTLILNGTLLPHAGYSAFRLLVGVAIGTYAGISTGVWLARSGTADRLFSPMVQFLAGVPVVVWIPFWVMLLGTEEAFKIAMVAITSYFLVHLAMFQAMRAVQRDFVELAEMYEKGHSERFWAVYLPSATPAIFFAVRTSLALGWVVVFFVEYASARRGSEGLGWFIADSRAVGRIEEEFAGLVLLAVLAFVADLALGAIQRRLLVWTDPDGGSGGVR